MSNDKVIRGKYYNDIWFIITTQIRNHRQFVRLEGHTYPEEIVIRLNSCGYYWDKSSRDFRLKQKHVVFIDKESIRREPVRQGYSREETIFSITAPVPPVFMIMISIVFIKFVFFM